MHGLAAVAVKQLTSRTTPKTCRPMMVHTSSKSTIVINFRRKNSKIIASQATFQNVVRLLVLLKDAVWVASGPKLFGLNRIGQSFSS